MVTLQQMFGTVVASPSEQPLGVTLIDGYNLLYRVSTFCSSSMDCCMIEAGGGNCCM